MEHVPTFSELNLETVPLDIVTFPICPFGQSESAICADTAGLDWTIRLMETGEFKTPMRINLHITAIFVQMTK